MARRQPAALSNPVPPLPSLATSMVDPGAAGGESLRHACGGGRARELLELLALRAVRRPESGWRTPVVAGHASYGPDLLAGYYAVPTNNYLFELS